jgi:regulator of RNase E activity RraA
MKFTNILRKRFKVLSTTNIADALDSLGLKGVTCGIRPMHHSMGPVLGPAVTIKMTAAGLTPPKHHLGMQAITLAQKGDVIIIDNGGRLDTSCWGGILTAGAKMKGVAGVVIDGSCRDVGEYVSEKFSVYARGAVVATARGRIMEEATNVIIQFGGAQVRPGDIVMGDLSGVVVIPAEYIEEVLKKAEQLYEKETAMIEAIKKGRPILEVDNEFRYERMLTNEKTTLKK